ncbi:MAG: ABC transporter ATP-binding protein [Sedimentisphaerales bacterium]|nr:ABC transporter ATP-binding protein [Sedimentisphaerales bacterium]
MRRHIMTNSDYFAIQTSSLTKHFRDFWGHKRVLAVNDLELEVFGREVFGLLGPNGSGKSTTIKMLLGLLFPSRGWARVLGRPPGDVKANAHIGYLPEESHLYPFLNARETLDFYGRLFGLSRPERRRRIDSLLDMVGLASVGRRLVGQYSKGMARRLGLAQALINDPDLLILDEPTAGLDPIGTRQIKDLIKELGRRGKTVLLCSHLLADVEDVCDRIAILYGGEMQKLGAVNDLLVQRELTEIRSGRLSDLAVERVRDIIREDTGQDDIDIRNPRERLEEFFLHTVAQAREQQKRTSGAEAGGGLSDFLGAAAEDRPAGIIDQLVAGREHDVRRKEQVETTRIVASAPPTVRHDVLEDLVKPTTTPVTPQAPTPDQRPAEQKPETKTNKEEMDHSLIDDLTGKKKE